VAQEEKLRERKGERKGEREKDERGGVSEKSDSNEDLP
jgi:hypothetical protein